MWYQENSEYNKLVRDNIPEIIESHWVTPIIHIASSEEFFDKLKNKLTEEVQEYLNSTDTEELVDILEVIYAIAEYQNITIDKLEEIRLAKQFSRWGFKKKIILERTQSQVKNNLEK